MAIAFACRARVGGRKCQKIAENDCAAAPYRITFEAPYGRGVRKAASGSRSACFAGDVRLPLKGVVMTPKVPLHFFRLSRGLSATRIRLSRLAEEVSENEGMPEHAHKAADPIKWDINRIQRIGDAYVYVATDAFGPGRDVVPWPAKVLQ